MDNSWIKLHRKFIESPVWKYATSARYPILIKFWMYLLMSVNWEEKKWYTGKTEIVVTPGSLIFSLQHLSGNLGISIRTTRTCLAHLENMQMIIRKTTNKWTQVWIVNWAKYQGGIDGDDTRADKRTTNNITHDPILSMPSTDTQHDKQDQPQPHAYDKKEATNDLTVQRQTNDKRPTTTKEHKKIRKEDILSDQPKVSSNGKNPLGETPPKLHQRKSVEEQTQLQRICYFLEDTLHTRIVNWGKQAQALKMMLQAGFSEKQILWTIKKMAQDEFYADKGFDLMTVANNIDKVKAAARKVVNTYV